MHTAARLIPLRLPLTALLLCGAAGTVFALPQLQALLIYNRAAIDDGEIWRLITGNLVHFSPSHFLYDVVALFAAGALIEIRGYRHFATLCLVSGALIGAIVYIGSPEILVFGGLSGIVTAAVTWLCLNGLTEAGGWQRLCLLALICLAIKLGVEMALGSSLLAGAEPQTFVPVPASHVAGAATALLLFSLTRRAEVSTPPSLPSGG
jgi:rhomboid family GlyGly-CTERM serine protease